ncbi:hypothetical protein AVEN_273826-1 [Araneus ventricosus]|uniref:Uncharacterized protein n=1 Tax=Araneus ventricosus TaxID=182803 RepID=A0A4Y2TR14_ARAVE|nr:hypothetical protein AVEN_273825-1 [Araneus ventricosus]GBO01527.1 hypothetical protein AVEN_273826-1 [Araneus ventricosus]
MHSPLALWCCPVYTPLDWILIIMSRLEEIKEYGEEAVWDDFVKVTSDILGKPLPSTELKRCDLACLALIMMGSAVKICR